MRFLALLLAAGLLIPAFGCGGSDGDAGESGTLPGSGTLQARLDSDSAEDSALIFSTSDFAVGENRIGFLLVAKNGKLVQAPTASVLVAPRGLGAAATRRVQAELVPLGPHSHPRGAKPHDHGGATDLYVANVRFDRPGRYGLVVEPERGPIQGFGLVDVKRRSASLALGSRAFPSDNPTLADAPAERITTARPPDRELLRYSIEDSLAAGVPFVAVFATPKFCSSRTCGPTVEVVDKVRRQVDATSRFNRARFIHVEVYRENDPSKGVNRFMREWKLPTEPWVFVVDRKGRIRAKFEGSVSVRELESAVRKVL